MNSHPKIAVCAFGPTGHELLSFIVKQNCPIAAVATYHRDDPQIESKINQLAIKNHIQVFRKIHSLKATWIRFLSQEQLDLVFLAWWPEIIPKGLIRCARQGWINLHPSLLPWGRGKHAYYWSIAHSEPFGVSIHQIDQSIDGGKVLFQKKIRVTMVDTGETLYDKGKKEAVALFKKKYNKIIHGRWTARVQKKTGSFHFSGEIDKHSNIQLNARYLAQDLINRIRGRSFTSGPSAWFKKNGKKYYIRVQIEEAKKVDF